MTLQVVESRLDRIVYDGTITTLPDGYFIELIGSMEKPVLQNGIQYRELPMQEISQPKGYVPKRYECALNAILDDINRMDDESRTAYFAKLKKIEGEKNAV